MFQKQTNCGVSAIEQDRVFDVKVGNFQMFCSTLSTEEAVWTDKGEKSFITEGFLNEQVLSRFFVSFGNVSDCTKKNNFCSALSSSTGSVIAPVLVVTRESRQNTQNEGNNAQKILVRAVPLPFES